MRKVLLFILLSTPMLAGILPRPQFQERLPGAVDLSKACIEGTQRLAVEMLRKEARSLGFERSSCDSRITLALRSQETRLAPDELRTLTEHAEQGYVIRTEPNRVWLIAATGQGLLYAATTLLQLWQVRDGRLMIDGVHVLDYPDFRFRASADWLLQGEINRWAYDWGDGRAAYIARVKRKLGFALRFKINMIFFDGFGWKPDRIPGYSGMMRELNQYARERGIKLMFGGYGSYFDRRNVRPEHNIGVSYENRHHYPDGPVYFCMPGDPLPRYGEEVALRTYGTCRANAELSDLVARDLEDFVRSVEPGALYIHHEDHGDFEPTEQGWKFRCEYCRRKWPNDSLKARDGGAGAIASRYRTLLEAVQRVRNPATGYDAARDCTVVLISPVYRLKEHRQEDWTNVLDFWESVLSILPRELEFQAGFREIFRNASTGQTWMDAYRERMASKGLPSSAFLFLLGGSQGYQNRHPMTATASLNGQFSGAETIYNFSGSANQEPLQVLNASYAWNRNTPGSRNNTGLDETRRAWNSLVEGGTQPDTDVLADICEKLYGDGASGPMMEYLRLRSERGVPPLVVLYDVLERESELWTGKPRPDLATRWREQAVVNGRAVTIIERAIGSAGLPPDVRGDLEYLRKCLETARLFSVTLAALHQSAPAARQPLDELSSWLHKTFAFDLVCPLGGDQASWLEAERKLRNLLSTNE